MTALFVLAGPAAAQIVPPSTESTDAETYQDCREAALARGEDELEAARECVPEERAFVLCVGTGRVTRAEIVRCVEVQVDDAYATAPTATTTTAPATTTTTTAEPTATTEPETAAAELVEEVGGGGGGDDGVGIPVVIGVGLAGLALGALLGAAVRGRGSDGPAAGASTPVGTGVPAAAPVAVPAVVPAEPTASASATERDELVQALIDAADQVSSDAVRTAIVHRLAAVGVEPILVGVGEPFDPTSHRGIDAAPASSPEQSDTVAALERPGWVDRGRVLRPPEVVVNRWEAGSS